MVVDCDLRTPALHERFGISNDVGLSTLLTSSSTPCDALEQVQVDGTTITVLPAGPPPHDPADLFLGVHAAQAISALTERFRYVVLDCPPILSFADTMTLPGWSTACSSSRGKTKRSTSSTPSCGCVRSRHRCSARCCSAARGSSRGAE